MTTDKILDAEGVASELRCSLTTAEDLMRTEEIASTKIGRSWITTYSEVLQFIARRIRRRRPAEPARRATWHDPESSKRRGSAPPALPEI